MKTLDQAENYFNSTALPLLRQNHGEILPELAFGMAGRGSECFGYDDELSCDHDHRIGFGIYLTRECERKHGFALERFYRQLLKDFPPPNGDSEESFYGGLEHGVIIIEDYFERHLGFPGVPQNFQQWLYTPEYAFAEAVNGRVFCDNKGIWSGIRSQIINGMPEDVRIKKLAARSLTAAQSGQYNFSRCMKRGEKGAAALALNEFVNSVISMIFLLNKCFAPYYKWQFRAMSKLPRLSELKEPLEKLLLQSNLYPEKARLIEDIAQVLIGELILQDLSTSTSDYLEHHAFELMKQIRSREIAALHILEG